MLYLEHFGYPIYYDSLCIDDVAVNDRECIALHNKDSEEVFSIPKDEIEDVDENEGFSGELEFILHMEQMKLQLYSEN
jgi:hypothetical protein